MTSQGTFTELQTQVDAFDHIYNTERPHQGLPGRITPHAAWEATTKADAPRPQPDPPVVVKHHQRALLPKDLPAGTHLKTLGSNGTFTLAAVTYKVAGRYAFEQVIVTTDDDSVIVANLEGEVLIEHTGPDPGVRYVGNGKPSGLQPKTR